MSDLPSTSNVKVATIAATWEIVKQMRSVGTDEETFEAMLERFLSAYKAISIAADYQNPNLIDVPAILETIEKNT